VRISVGALWLAQNCYATAGRWFSGAYRLSAKIGDRHREAHARQRLALLHQCRGNLGEAREELDRAIAIFDELGDDHCVGYAHQSLGRLCSGDLAHARLLQVNPAPCTSEAATGARKRRSRSCRANCSTGSVSRARPRLFRTGAGDLAGPVGRPQQSALVARLKTLTTPHHLLTLPSA
jgi:hypothetical protein